MIPEHDPLAPVRQFPTEIKRDLQTLIVDRKGESEGAFMRTEDFLGHVVPGEKYRLELTGMSAVPDASIPDLPVPKEPPHAVLAGVWDSHIDLTIDDANILGGNGRYIVGAGQNELIIPEAETTPGHLAYYGCRLVPLGGYLDFSANAPLPITVTTVGDSYAVDYLFNAKHGGGEYLEIHDQPHFHMPLEEAAGGYLIIGTACSAASRKVSAFNIPFGYGVLMAPWAIHSDAHLTGRYMVIYSITKNFSTVILKSKTGELVPITIS